MSSNDAGFWAKGQTIASIIALIAVIFAATALINERIQRARSRDTGSVAADPSKMGYFHVHRLSHWSAFNGYKTKNLIVTSIRGLIKAGDSRLWTSAALDELPATMSEICWVATYKNVFNEVARNPRTDQERDVFPENVRTFLDRADEEMRKESRYIEETKKNLDHEEQKVLFEEQIGKDPVKAQMMRKKYEKHKRSCPVDRNHFYQSLDLVNCCRGLDNTDPNAIDDFDDDDCLGLQDIQPTWLVGDKPCIPTSREELAAIALILGMPLKWHAKAPSLGGVGAFGTSLRAAQENGTWRLHLMQAARIPRHARSPGSGYTTLMAKHIACGSLPFAEISKWVRTIFVTDKVLNGIRAGGSVKDVQSFGGQALEYLRRLPAAKQTDAYYDIDPTPRSDAALGTILKSDGSTFPHSCTWPRAVTGIAFGGLVPQAAQNLAEAVEFTVAGKQGKCFEQLESLINTLHQHSMNKDIFGEFVSDRITAEHSVDNVNYTLPERSNDSRDAAAVFARYMTLLERVTARCEVGKDPVDAVFEAAHTLIHRVYVSAVRKDEASKGDREMDLGLALKEVRERLRPDKRIPLEDCAVVVRAIIAAWAWQVPYISWPENAAGGGLATNGNRGGEASGNRLVSLDDIPPVSALT